MSDNEIMLKSLVTLSLLFIMLSFSIKSEARKKEFLLSHSELVKMGAKRRGRYFKNIARYLQLLEKEPLAKYSFEWLEQMPEFFKSGMGPKNISYWSENSLVPRRSVASTYEYRCIGGGVPVKYTGAGQDCGVSSYAGFTCSGADEGKEICNPLIFGLKSNGNPVCYSNATTARCYQNIKTGSTAFFDDERFQSAEVKAAYEDFKESIDAICGGAAEVRESTRYKEEACGLVQKQRDVNRRREIGIAYAPAQAATTEEDSELAGGEGDSSFSPATSSSVDEPSQPSTDVDASDCKTRYESSGIEIPISYFNYEGEDDCAKVNEFLDLHDKYKSYQGPISTSMEAVDRALAFYVKNKNGIPQSCGGSREITSIQNQDYVIVSDFTKPHTSRRMFILNLKTGEYTSTAVAHGFGSNRPMSECPREHRICGGARCSIPINVEDVGSSYRTSRGFFLTGSGGRTTNPNFVNGVPYSGKGNNYILMHGLLSSNRRALQREVIFHRASYVHRNSVNPCSNSGGCPSIDPGVFENFKTQLDNGALMYNHTIEDEKRNQPDC